MIKISRGVPLAEYPGSLPPGVEVPPLVEEIDDEDREEIHATLEAHVVDIAPQEIGRRELWRTLTDASVGAAEAMVGRPDPPIDVIAVNVARGKSKVLIGPNGAGKSTVFDAMMERGAHFETRSGRGAVVFGRPTHAREKLRIARLDQEELLGKIDKVSARHVLQEAAAYFKAQFPIAWENAGAYDYNLVNQEAHVRIEELMGQITKLFDMEPFLERKVRELSGGERTKLALIMTLLSEPDVLLLDEPTNHLDLRSIAKLTELFVRYKKVGVAIMSVSHVDWFLEEAGQDGVVEIVWKKGQGRRLQDSNAPYHKYVQDAARERVPIISGDITWPQRDYSYRHGTTLMETPTRFSVSNSPLKEVACPNVLGGELIILSGDNGTGKTKLMEAMLQGQSAKEPHRLRGVQVGYLPQFWPEQVTRGTLEDFFFWVKEQTSPQSKGSSVHPDKTARNAFVELAQGLQFGGSSRIGESWLRRPFAKFSGGEQRLLWFLVVSALRDVDMLMLDEPTNHMDQDLQEKITRAIQSFPGAVVLSTHDRRLMKTLTGDGGIVRGMTRTPKHIVLERRGDTTTVAPSNESPSAYMTRVMQEARRKAQKLKL